LPRSPSTMPDGQCTHYARTKIHWTIRDEEGMADYNFKVTGAFKKCLDRQIDEGLRINECELDVGTILNSKNEFFAPKIVETV
jgi:hypothetical protein